MASHASNTRPTATPSERLEEIHKEIIFINKQLEIADNGPERLQSKQLLQVLRRKFDMLARPMIRKLTVLDLPTELLFEVLEQMEDPESTASVKNSRLVCRRFHDLSSQFLIRHVRIAPDLESLARLEEISRHPFISRGVTNVLLALNFHSPQLNDFHRFTEYLLHLVDQNIVYVTNGPQEAARNFPLPEVGTISMLSFRSFAQDLRRVLPLTAAVRYRTRARKRVQQSDDPFLQRLQQVFAKYQEVLHTEKTLMLGSGQLGTRVAEAIARMPRARNLTIEDCETDIDTPVHRDRWWEEVLNQRLDENFELTWDLVEQYMLRPMFDRHNDIRTPDYVYKSIVPVLNLLQTSGVLLNSLEMRLADLTRFRDLNPENAEESGREGLTALTQRLKRFVFCHHDKWGYRSPTNPYDPEDVDGVHQFLAATLDTSSLEYLQFSFEDTGRAGRWRHQRMGLIDFTKVMGTTRSRKKLDFISMLWAVLDANKWTILTDLLPTTMKEINMSVVSLLLDGDPIRAFQDEAWRHLLDGLREKKPKKAEIVHPHGPWTSLRWAVKMRYEDIFSMIYEDRHQLLEDLPEQKWVNHASHYVLSGSGGYDFPNPFDLYK